MSSKLSDNLLKELVTEYFNDIKALNAFDSDILSGIWYLDLDNPDVEFLSDNFWRTFNELPSEQDSSPDAWRKFVDKHDLAVLDKVFEQHLKNPSKPFNQILKFRLENGDVKYILCRGKYLKSEVSRVIGIHIDLSDIVTGNAHAGHLMSVLVNDTALDENHILIVDSSLHKKDESVIPNSLSEVKELIGVNGESLLKHEIANLIDTENQTCSGHLDNNGNNWDFEVNYIARDTFLVVLKDQSAIRNKKLELARKNQVLELILKIISDIEKCEDSFNQCIDRAIKEIGQHFEADRVYIFDYNFEAGTTSNTNEWCRDGVEPQIDNLQDVSLDGIEDQWLELHRRGLELFIPVVEEYGNSIVRGLLLEQGIKSLLTIPVFSYDRLVGFIGIDWVHSYSSRLSGQLESLKILASFIGISLARRKQRRKKEFERQFAHDVIQNIELPIFVQNPSGRIIEFNDAFSLLIGLNRSDILNSDPPYFFLEEIDRIPETLPIRGVWSEADIYVTRPDGRKIHVSLKREIVRFGSLYRILNTCTDLSSLDLSRKELQHLHQFLQLSQAAGLLGHFYIDAQNSLEVSPMFRSLLELDDLQEYSILQLLKRVRVEWRQVIKHFKDSLRRKAALRQTYEVRLGSKIKWFECIAYFESSSNSAAFEIRGTIRDVSDEIRYVKSIELQNVRLREIAWMQSHELRAPISKILGLVDQIKDEDGSWIIESLKQAAQESDEVIRAIVKKSEGVGVMTTNDTPNLANRRLVVHIVDDDPLSLLLNEMMLEKHVSEVELLKFNDASQSIKKIEADSDPTKFYLIFLDINMPKMNGWQYLDYLNQSRRMMENSLVVMVSSSVDTGDKQKAYGYSNVVGFIEKPLNKFKLHRLEADNRISAFFRES